MKSFLLFACAFVISSSPSFSQAKKEFRGVWIATVDNIDFPTRGNFNPDSQRAEYIRILDMHKRNGMNAVVVQVRPATDAFYPSPYEPWSEWLTGKQGRPPFPYYDPLQFMIDEAHRRGMEFHAWCNPYRAEFNIGKSSISPTHITRMHPEWFLTYGDKRYFDPGNKEAQKFVVNVIRDIVSRYDIDAIHFDDYFYPYRIAGKEFPDYLSFEKHGNGLSRDDWRRSNVDSVILALSRAIKEEKEYCRFGISPFCVWRNDNKDPEGSATKAGMTNYDDLYADIVLWLKKGWIDYVAPQLYLEYEHPTVPFDVILDWWSKHTYGKHCYIGLAMYRANSNANWRNKKQLPKMIEAVRNTPNMHGTVFFSSKSFVGNPNGWSDSLRLNYFKDPVGVPSMEWLPALPEYVEADN
ncbi:MAG: family 10 glycosylhydrolase [Gemmatimonadaceae bacterium]|nr:family 10 glycosylhydrolase [Chitinophagaceae bacterium]